MGHIALTVSGTTYQFVVDPDTYSEVDIVDFAPRAVAGTPAFSEMGLYLEVAQLGFGHGFGRMHFTEPASYAYTGNLVDTSHDILTLYTDPVQIYSAGSNWKIEKMFVHRDTMVVCSSSGLWVVKSDGTTLIETEPDTWWRDGLSNGDYFFLARGSRMQIGDLGAVKSATSTTLVSNEDPEWTADLFNGGAVYITEGTGAGQVQTVTDTTYPDTLTVASWSTQPDATSRFLVRNNAGAASNPPNNFWKLAISGGHMWACEKRFPWVHYWTEMDGTDAEGGQDTDTAAVRIGPGDVRIQSMLSAQNQLYVFRQDGLWAVGDDKVAYHTLDFGDQTHSYNFWSTVLWNGFTIFPIRRSLYKYRSGLQDITPPAWSEELPFSTFGEFRGIVARGKFLYVLGQSNAANTAEESTEAAGFVTLLKTDGVGWHKVVSFSQANPNDFDMWLDPGSNRIYIFIRDSSNSTGYLYYVRTQTHSEYPYPSYPTSGDHNWYSSYFDLGLKRISKSYAAVLVEGDFPTGTTVTAYFRVDDTTSWTSLGTFSGSMSPLTFPAGTTGKKIQIKLNLKTTDSTKTPTIRALVIKQMLRPSVLYGATMDVIVQDDLNYPDGRKLGMTADEIRTALKAARDSVAPITFRNLWGDSSSAYVSSLRFVVNAFAGEQDDIIESRARMTVVNV